VPALDAVSCRRGDRRPKNFEIGMNLERLARY
jgi:hypothetical protein